MKFDTSSEAHEFIENVAPRVGARNQAILGRAAFMLALGEGVPKEFKPKDAKGVTLNDEQVVGEELRDVVKAALNHRTGKALDEASYRHEFRRYFEYGCHRLKQVWVESGNDQARFVGSLLTITGRDLGLSLPTQGKVKAIPVVDKEVKLKVLNGSPEWSINGPGTKNGLLVISGESGSGKSQLALDLLAQLSAQGVRFVFFDLKGELEDDPDNARQRENRTKFLKQTGARYVRLIREDLPINPLYRDAHPAVNAQIANEISALIRAFAPQLGANQQQALNAAYQNLASPDFTSLLLELEQSGSTGVAHSIISRIVDCNLFASAQTAITPEEWLRGSLVIDFKEFGNDNDTKALCAALVLNFLMKKLNRNLAVKDGIQPIKMVLLMDEAHLLLPKESKAGLLSSLARQGRSWGFPVWLASQDADKFLTTGANETNFADLAECGVHFSPHTLSDAQQKAIIGGVVHQKFKKAEAVLRFQGKMLTGMSRQFWIDGGR